MKIYTSNFPKKKKLLAYEREEYTLWENAGLQAWGVRNSAFMTSQKLNMVELATVVYLVNRMSYKVDL